MGETGSVKEMRLIGIAKFIVEKYPDSCIATNGVVDQCDIVDEEYAKDILIDEILDFFAYEKLGLCGCGIPEDTWEVIRQVLKIQQNNHDNINISYDEKMSLFNQKLGIDVTDNMGYGTIQFILYVLDHCGLLNHGSSIGSAWLTVEGEMYLKVLDIWHEREEEKDERK